MTSRLDPRRLLDVPGDVRRFNSAVVDLVERFEQLTTAILRQTEETVRLQSVAESLRSETTLTRSELDGLRKDLDEIRKKIPGL